MTLTKSLFFHRFAKTIGTAVVGLCLMTVLMGAECPLARGGGGGTPPDPPHDGFVLTADKRTVSAPAYGPSEEIHFTVKTTGSNYKGELRVRCFNEDEVDGITTQPTEWDDFHIEDGMEHHFTAKIYRYGTETHDPVDFRFQVVNDVDNEVSQVFVTCNWKNGGGGE